jgi:virulence factor Mce-like protein
MPRTHRDPARFYPLLGAVLVLAVVGTVYVAFNANRSLPFRSSHHLTVELRNAAKLAPTNDVRIGGVRVGQVADVDAVAGGGRRPPVARVRIDLDTSVEPLPVDTTVKVRPASILGTNYLDLIPGRRSETVPWGGRLALSRSRSTVELTDLLNVFDRATARSVQSAITSVGGGLAGRGAALNRTLTYLTRLMAPLRRLGQTLSSPRARLARFVRAYDSFATTLAPVAGKLSAMLDGGATTFAAVAQENRALGDAIDATPSAELATTTALASLHPALTGLADLAADLQDPVGRLPAALSHANGAVSAGVEPLQELPGVTSRLGTTLATLGRVSREPATSGALRKLADLVTAGNVSLEHIVPGQVQCNIISLFAQSFGTAYGTVGFGQGPPMAFIGEKHLGSIGESLQNASPSSGIAINGNPHENYQECESGNEIYPYAALPVFNGPGKPLLGNPPGLQSNKTLDTYPPEGVHELGRRAGLLPLLSETRAGR